MRSARSSPFSRSWSRDRTIHATPILSSPSSAIRSICNRLRLFPNIPDFTDEQWDALVDGLNEIGKIAADQGRNLCYHPHLGTGVISPAAVECLFDRTDPRLVHMLLDTAHLMAGGCDALEITKRYAHRIKHVHLKDVRAEVLQKVHDENLSFEEAVVAGIFTVPGDGSIKTLPEILNQLAKAGFTGWLMIEAKQKPRGDEPLMYTKKARAFLPRAYGLVEMNTAPEREIYFSFFMFTADLRPYDLSYRNILLNHLKALTDMGYQGFDFHIAPQPTLDECRAAVDGYKRLKDAIVAAGLEDAKFTTNVGDHPRLRPDLSLS